MTSEAVITPVPFKAWNACVKLACSSTSLRIKGKILMHVSDAKTSLYASDGCVLLQTSWGLSTSGENLDQAGGVWVCIEIPETLSSACRVLEKNKMKDRMAVTLPEGENSKYATINLFEPASFPCVRPYVPYPDICKLCKGTPAPKQPSKAVIRTSMAMHTGIEILHYASTRMMSRKPSDFEPFSIDGTRHPYKLEFIHGNETVVCCGSSYNYAVAVYVKELGE